jgi:hypothetical protein
MVSQRRRQGRQRRELRKLARSSDSEYRHVGRNLGGRGLLQVGRLRGGGGAAYPEIPNSRSPDSRFGRETGRESPFPDSAATGKQGTPVSRFGRERESGSRLAANHREIGDAPLSRCEYSMHDPGLESGRWMLPWVLEMQIQASPLTLLNFLDHHHDVERLGHA